MNPPLGFGGLLLAGTVLIACLGGRPVELALEGGAGMAAVVVGLSLLRRRRRLAAGPPRSARSARSGATVLLAIGIGTMAFGAEIGQWLLLIGAGTASLGVAGLIAERRRA